MDLYDVFWYVEQNFLNLKDRSKKDQVVSGHIPNTKIFQFNNQYKFNSGKARKWIIELG